MTPSDGAPPTFLPRCDYAGARPGPTPRSSRSPTVVALRSAVGVLAVLAVLLLAGCSGPAVPAMVTVNGRVIDLYAPIANASVLVDGKVATTASDGTFTVAKVATPYDVTVSFQSSTDVWIYRGLTRPDPTIQIYAVSTSHQATVSGSIGTAPYQTGEVGAVFPAGATVSVGGASVQSGTTFGPGTIRWGPDDPLTVTLYAIRALTDGNGNPTSYTAFGSLAVTLHDGDSLAGLTVPTQAVSTASLSGSFTLPSGFGLVAANAVVRFGSTSAGSLVGIPLANFAPPGSFSNTEVPVANGISYGLAGEASGSTGWTTAWGPVSAPNPAATLTLPSPPQPMQPTPDPNAVAPGTSFTSSSLAGSIYMFVLAPSGSAGPKITVLTADPSTTLPDLSGINRALPANTGYTYEVLTVGSFASMNAAAGPDGLFSHVIDLQAVTQSGSGPIGISGPDQPSWFTLSSTVSFTTAP